MKRPICRFTVDVEGEVPTEIHVEHISQVRDADEPGKMYDGRREGESIAYAFLSPADQAHFDGATKALQKIIDTLPKPER